MISSGLTAAIRPPNVSSAAAGAATIAAIAATQRVGATSSRRKFFLPRPKQLQDALRLAVVLFSAACTTRTSRSSASSSPTRAAARVDDLRQALEESELAGCALHEVSAGERGACSKRRQQKEHTASDCAARVRTAPPRPVRASSPRSAPPMTTRRRIALHQVEARALRVAVAARRVRRRRVRRRALSSFGARRGRRRRRRRRPPMKATVATSSRRRTARPRRLPRRPSSDGDDGAAHVLLASDPDAERPRRLRAVERGGRALPPYNVRETFGWLGPVGAARRVAQRSERAAARASVACARPRLGHAAFGESRRRRERRRRRRRATAAIFCASRAQLGRQVLARQKRRRGPSVDAARLHATKNGDAPAARRVGSPSVCTTRPTTIAARPRRRAGWLWYSTSGDAASDPLSSIASPGRASRGAARHMRGIVRARCASRRHRRRAGRASARSRGIALRRGHATRAVRRNCAQQQPVVLLGARTGPARC